MAAEKTFPFIITIGASAGGLNAISEIVSQLPPDINAAVFVVLHLSKAAMSDILLSRIQKNSSLPCKIAEDRESIRKGQIYIAAPDTHLLLKENQVIIGQGPPENRFRPSIDVLFRSAAASHDGRVIGIILTGFLNDGTIGMQSIKRSGGYSIVQDPNEAEYPDMPLAVLESIEVDQVVPLKKMLDAILERINTPEIEQVQPPEDIVAESRLSEKAATAIDEVSKLGQETKYTCPDCGGRLWHIQNGKLTHYRCHIGHVYSEEDLLLRQAETAEQTLWAAVRMMEERKLLIEKMAKHHSSKGLQRLRAHYIKQGTDLEHHITKLKELLFAVSKE
jgi:two-component system, chemotaxis family, protein-glutamate methylesterase/glutaminase